MAIMDGKRSRITKEDLCDHAWEYRFTLNCHCELVDVAVKLRE